MSSESDHGRILPFTPRPQQVATHCYHGQHLRDVRMKRREEFAKLQRRVLPFQRPQVDEAPEHVAMPSTRDGWEHDTPRAPIMSEMDRADPRD
jgi:hypothetical protein